MNSGKKTYKKTGIRLLMVLLAALVMMTTPSMSFAATKAEKRAEKIMKTMTWKEKVAQMFVVSVPMSSAAAVQKKYQFGGYIFFANDFKGRTPKKVKTAISNIQKKSKVKALMSVDEEGGSVVRISKYSAYRKKPFQSPRDLYKKGGYTAITKDTKEKDKLLKSMGINTNYAPLADVPYSSKNFIYKRSFSTNAQSTAKYVKTVVTQMKKDNIVSVMKHFPGYGGNGDTHTKVIKDSRSKKTFESRDLKPFSTGIKAGCDMIMVSHNIVKCFDSKSPASVSKKVHTYLRDKMKFKGVIITDSLSMKGVAGYSGNSGQVAVKAVQAGNDLLLCQDDYKTQYNAVYNALKSGKIKKSQVNASVKRILVMKLNRGIIK